MKFHFTKKTAIRNKANIRRQFARKKASSVSITKFYALVQSEEIDLFGSFEKKIKKRKNHLSDLWQTIKIKLLAAKKSLSARAAKKVRKPPTRSSLIFGAICGVLSVSAVSGILTIVALFGAYGGKYVYVTVPELISLSKEEAVNTQDDVFEYTLVYRYNPDRAVGSVISQSPSANVSRRLYNGGEKIKITLVINEDTPSVSLPSLNGMTVRDAALLLKNSGINVKITEEYSNTAPTGTVILCSHPKGSVVKVGDSVVLRASKGRATVYATVPELKGLGEADARQTLAQLGLSVGNITYKSSASPLGTVISQEYEKGASLPEGTKISLVISGGQYFAE